MLMKNMNRSQRYDLMSRPPTFITNIDIDDIPMTLQVALDVKIEIEIQKEATDVHGNVLLTCVSVHTNESEEKRNEFSEAMVSQIRKNNDLES